MVQELFSYLVCAIVVGIPLRLLYIALTEYPFQFPKPVVIAIIIVIILAFVSVPMGSEQLVEAFRAAE